MSTNAGDPRCPACDGPVSATAIYCMHCGMDFDETTFGAAAVDGEPDRFLDPDGTIDNSLTILVGLAGGALVGLLSLALVGVITQSVWSVVPGGLAFVVGTGYLATRRSVGAAIQKGCYAVGLLLVLLPIIAFSPAVKGGDVAGRIVLFLVAELVFGLFALAIAGVGYVVGTRRNAAA